MKQTQVYAMLEKERKKRRKKNTEKELVMKMLLEVFRSVLAME